MSDIDRLADFLVSRGKILFFALDICVDLKSVTLVFVGSVLAMSQLTSSCWVRSPNSPRELLVDFPLEGAAPALSSNKSLKDLPPAGALTGESETKDESGLSSSSSLLDGSVVSLGNGRIVCEPTRRRLPLFGEGETGSPRRRLRALERALVAAGGD